MGKVIHTVFGAAIVLALTSCSTEGGVSSETRYYSTAISMTEMHLAEIRSRIPEELVERDEMVVNDLDRDSHRLTCSETTSLYSNAVNVWLTLEGDSVALVDELRDGLVSEGWVRSDSVEEQLDGEQDPRGLYQQLLESPSGFDVTLSRWATADEGEGIQIAVRSPCVPNPPDKPDYWGK